MNHCIVHHGLVGCSLAVMQEAYLSTFLQFANDPRVVEGVRLTPPVGMPEELDWLQRLSKRKGTDHVFAVLRHDGEVSSPRYIYIGHTGVHGILWPNATGVTGSLLGDLENLGKGHGTEAKLLLQYHAFRILGLRKLTSGVKSFNARSLGHLIKCGYRIVGRYKEHEFHNGGYVDEILLECFREDWEPVWEQYQATRELPKLTDAQRDLVCKETGQE